MSAKFSGFSKLGVETLEAREVPAILSVQNLTTKIVVTADNNGSNVTISRPTLASDLKITDHQTGQTWTFHPSASLDLKKVKFVGGSGADCVSATDAWQRVSLYGNGGTDGLIGGLMKDYIDGGTGNDTLKGGGSNDTIYGRSGIDSLFGHGGSDFLDDGGSTGDTTDGGSGADFLARKPVRFGILPTDVNQGATPTCWVYAALSSAASQGIDFASRISYQGEGVYRVKLMNEDGGHSYQYVNLEGGRLSFEANPQGDESWVILFHRAIMQELDVDWKDKDAYSGGNCADIMPMLTGREADNHTAYGWEFTVSFLHDMRNALLQNKLVCAGTRQGDYDDFGSSVSTPKLVGAHCYHVLNVNFDTNQVTLRNPWGTDGWNCYDGDNDGLVKISLDQFMDSFDTVGIS